MREIKFRAWDKKYKSMHLFEDMQARNVFALADGLAPEQFIILPKHENIVLMQFTGLLDKNGKEIYEGDIVQAADGSTAVVRFEMGCYFWRKTPLIYEPYEGLEVFDPKDWATVIGNIYQHPSLIK